MRGILVAAIAIGCGSAHAVVAPPAPVTKPVDLVAAKAAIEKLLADQQAAYQAMDMDAWWSTLDYDGLALGPGPHDVWQGSAAAKAATHGWMGKIKDNGDTISVTASDLHVGIAPDGSAAWTSEQLALAITGRPILTTRVVEVLAQIDGNWVAQVEDLSVGVPNDFAFQFGAAGKWPALAPLPDRVDRGAAPAVAVWKKDISDDFTDAPSIISKRDDVHIFGTAPEESWTGAQYLAMIAAAGPPAKDALPPPPDVIGPIRAALVPGGRVAWLVANTAYHVVVQGKTITQPYRVLAVFLDEDGTWREVSVTASNGIP